MSSTPAKWAMCRGALRIESQGGEGFLRYVFYFRHPMHPQVDDSSHRSRTTFTVETLSFKELPALAEAKGTGSQKPAPGRRVSPRVAGSPGVEVSSCGFSVVQVEA